MKDHQPIRGFGVGQFQDKIFLFVAPTAKKTAKFRLFTSPQGERFKLHSQRGEIKTRQGKLVKTGQTSHWRVSKLGRMFLLNFLTASGRLATAYSANLVHWQKIVTQPAINQPGLIIPDYQYNDQSVLLFGRHDLRVAFSRDLQHWQVNDNPILSLNTEQTHNGKLEIANVIVTDQHLLAFYFLFKQEQGVPVYSLRVAFLNKNNPGEHNRKLHQVLWQQRGGWAASAQPIGLVKDKQSLISYWQTDAKQILTLRHEHHQSLWQTPEDKSFYPLLTRLADNPILRPVPGHWWESLAVFNPAAVKQDDKIHLVYRAVGQTYQSMLGYASSQDGLHFDQRSDQPIFAPSQNFEGGNEQPASFCSLQFISGGAGDWGGWAGGYGGCEDPRLTKIGDRLYLIYVAFDGWSEPRLAMTSISAVDFGQQRWQWQKPVLISKPGEINKSGCLLPEKINGKYVLFHRVFPDILIDFIDDLDHLDGQTWLKGQYRIQRREDYWDSRKVCVGATPIKTSEGWLVIYNAVDDLDDRIYKLGAMLLDRQDPTRVLYRCRAPILTAETGYENGGLKYGVAYACGAVEHQGKLIAYYGGSDEFVCVAHSPMEEFLDKLKKTGQPRLQPLEQPVKMIH